MKTVSAFLSATALAALMAAPVAAQSTLTGISDLEDRIDDISEAAQRDLDRQRDAARFGPNNVPQGWRGSLALSATAKTGSVETGELSLASRLTYGIGSWNHSIGLAAEYGRSGKETTKREFFGTYEANRFFSNDVYAFGLGRYQFNDFSTEKHDAFVGFGPGYRVLNSETTTWRVQAGPGVRWTRNDAGDEQTEASGIASSRLWMALTDTMSLTNDTDVLFSKQSIVASNDLGLNVRMTDTLSTRFSYRTDYNDTAAEKYDNTLGVSLVMSF